MPWDMNSVPPPAKTKPPKLQRACVLAANAALERGDSEEEAIHACLGAMQNIEASLEMRGALTVQASEDGSVLYFENAVLCRAERNANMDILDEQGVAEIAASLALQPINVEHQMGKVCGSFTEGVPEGLAVKTKGVLWPTHYPEEVNDVRSGRMFLSVEARARSAVCSSCGGEFLAVADYCEHLSAPIAERRRLGYGRKLSGMSSRGAAITKRPAGSFTQFDSQAMHMIASLQADDEDLALVQKLDLVLRRYGFRVLEVADGS